MKNIKLYLFTATIGLLGFNACTPAITQVNPTVQQHQQAVEVQQNVETTTQQIESTTQQIQTATSTKAYEAASPEKMTRYANTMKKVASGIKDDTNYQRIALDTTEKKEWFKDLTFRLWDRQITRQQFLAEGLAKYPTHQYELQFIINGFEKITH